MTVRKAGSRPTNKLFCIFECLSKLSLGFLLKVQAGRLQEKTKELQGLL